MFKARVPVLVAALLVCGCPPAGGPIDPATAKPSDLTGYWLHTTDPDAGGTPEKTVFGFAPNAQAAWEMPLAENMVDAGTEDVGAVYLGPPYYGLLIQQLTTFSIKDGAIFQTVLADANAAPGQQYSTKIYEITPRKSMVLASKKDPSGKRTWTWSERCPSNNEAGWDTYAGQQCPTAFSLGTSLTFDRFNDVHAVSGQGATVDSCMTPTFTDITKGCVGRQTLSPNFYLSSLVVGPDDVLRMAYNTQVSPVIHLRERPLHGDTWTDTVIDAEPQTTYEMKLFDDANGRLLVLRTNEKGTVFYRWNGTTWDKSFGSLPDGGQVFGYRSISRDPAGHVVVQSGASSALALRETNGTFSPIDLPALPAGFTGVYDVKVDALGRIHAIFPGALVSSGGFPIGNRGSFGVAENGVWKLWPLPIFYAAWLVPHPDGTPRVVVTLEKVSVPSFALVTADGDKVKQELLDVAGPTGGSSVPPHVHTAVEAGPDGSIAASFDGQTIWVRRPEGPVRARPSALVLKFNGKTGTRVYSTDGKVDCTTDCSVPYLGGSRVELVLENKPGYAASLNCYEMMVGDTDRCFVNVREASSIQTVAIQRTPVRFRQQVQGGSLSALAYRFGISGKRSAWGTELNSGAVFAIDGVEFPLANRLAAHGIAFFDRATKTGWHSELPVIAEAVAPADDGGAWAIVSLTGVTTIQGTMVGEAGKTSIVRLRFGPTGALIGSTPLVAASGISLAVLGQQTAAFVTPAGEAAGVVASGSGFPTQGLTEHTAVATVSAAGVVKLVGLDAEQAQAASVVIEGGRTLVGAMLSSGVRLLALDAAATVTGSKTIAGTQLKGVSLRADRLGVSLASTNAASPVDLGGGMRTGTAFVAQYDLALTWSADVVLPQTIQPIGFALLPEGGAMVFDKLKVYALSATLALRPMGDDTGLLANTPIIALGQDDQGLGVLVQGLYYAFKPTPD